MDATSAIDASRPNGEVVADLVAHASADVEYDQDVRSTMDLVTDESASE